MSRTANVFSVSLPEALVKEIDRLAKKSDQNRSELIREVLREFLDELHEEAAYFKKVYRATRHEKVITHEELKKKLKLN